MTRAVRRAFLPTTFGLVALVALPAAHAQDARRAFAEDSHVFRRILFDADFAPLHRFHELADDPAHTILIVLGDTDGLAQVPGGLESFVRRGGAVLVATDQPVGDANVRQQIQAVSGVVFLRQPRRSDPRKLRDFCYKGLEFCPFALPLRKGGPELFVDSQGVALRVATNVPAVLDDPIRDRKLLGKVKPLAQLPEGFGHVLLRIGRFEQEQTLFAVGGDVGDGRVVVLADHSVFINEMMLPENNHNVEFTTNCVTWLSGDGKQRKKVLFVDNGQVRDSFDIPLKYETLPLDKAIAAAVGVADQQLGRLSERLAQPEGQAAINSFLRQWLADRRVSTDLFDEVVLIAVTLTLLLFGCYRIGVKGRYRLDQSVPLLARVVEPEAPPRPLWVQRQEALLRTGNLWETARELARQCFASPAALRTPPRIVARGGWWRRWQTRRRVRRLWQLAHSERPVRVSPRRLKSLLAEIEQLKAELRDGTVAV
jgi:hypothetical protein